MIRSLILTIAFAGLATLPCAALESSGGKNSSGNLSKSCNGLYWPPTKGNHGEYGCLFGGGGGLVCGGATAAQKGSCYRFTDSVMKIPSRTQIEGMTGKVSANPVSAKPK